MRGWEKGGKAGVSKRFSGEPSSRKVEKPSEHWSLSQFRVICRSSFTFKGQVTQTCIPGSSILQVILWPDSTI